MTKRLKLVAETFGKIAINDPVLFFSSSGIGYGFYRGTHKGTPVVEYFYKDKSFHQKNGKYFWDYFWSVKSRRVFLKERKIFGMATLADKFKNLNTSESLKALVDIENLNLHYI